MRSARWPDALRPAPVAPESLRYGLRLASAVLLSFVVSALLHLPEGFWAVMSALIVVRPDTGSTLGAGWDRIRGALVGTALGLAGAGLRHVGGAHELAPLVLVTLLAFAAGLSPALRSAPISALIVVTSGGIAGHSAGQVALLRALEIGIGIAAAVLVSLVDSRSRATTRFRAAAAAQLRALADAIVDPPAAPAREAADTARRLALRRLAVLAEAADREARLFARRRPQGERERHRKSARLLARIASDAALFARLRPRASSSAGVAPAPATWPPSATRDSESAVESLRPGPIEQAAATLLRSAADRLDAASGASTPPPAVPPEAPPCAGDAHVAWRLLVDDLDALARLEKPGPEPAG